MELQLTTPALLFSTISLLLLAFSNRYFGIASVIRNLYEKYKTHPADDLKFQIKNLKFRLRLIRDMQLIAVSSLLLSVLCMFMLFEGWQQAGRIIFAVALVFQIVSLALSVWEIAISTQALNILLREMEEEL